MNTRDESSAYPSVTREAIPSRKGDTPKYPYVLLSEDGSDWQASTANLQEGIRAFEHMVELGASAGIVYCAELDTDGAK